jgi:hypothetical protein
MDSGRVRFETIGPMHGDAIKAQIALVVKEYAARTSEGDPTQRALVAMRLREGVRRLLEGGHCPPPKMVAVVQTHPLPRLSAKSTAIFDPGDQPAASLMEDDMEDYGMSNHLMTEAAMDELEIGEVVRYQQEREMANEEDLLEEEHLEDEPEEEAPAPPPKPKHLCVQVESLDSLQELETAEPEILDSLPELGEE